MKADAHGPRRLAEECHHRRVAAEARDVTAHPLHGGLLVPETLVALEGIAPVAPRLCDEEPEGTEAVVGGYHHHASAVAHAAAVVQVEGALGPPLGERASVEPDQHGKAASSGLAAVVGRKNVEVEAVFALVGRHVRVVVHLNKVGEPRS